MRLPMAHSWRVPGTQTFAPSARSARLKRAPSLRREVPCLGTHCARPEGRACVPSAMEFNVVGEDLRASVSPAALCSPGQSSSASLGRICGPRCPLPRCVPSALRSVSSAALKRSEERLDETRRGGGAPLRGRTALYRPCTRSRGRHHFNATRMAILPRRPSRSLG